MTHTSNYDVALPEKAETSRRNTYIALVVGVVVAMIAWAIYRPDRVRPFDIQDFGILLPFLKRTDSFLEQVASIASHDASHAGRANIVQVVAAVLKWRLFGTWVPGWQITHASVILVVMVQTYFLLRRLGATRFGSLVAASIYLVAPAAARSWIRLPVGEPLGMIVILALTLRATRFQRAAEWPREVAFFAAGAIFVLLTKELMAPALLLPLLCALVWQSRGPFELPSWSRRNVVLVVSMGAVSLLTLVAVFLVYQHAPTAALASQYGHSLRSPDAILAIWIATVVPFDLAPKPVSLMWALAIAGLAMLVVAGWWIGIHDRADGNRSRCVLVVALLFPLLGAIAYAPWPAYEERYAFPYLVGTSVLLGMAVSYVQQSSPGGVRWALLGWGAVFAFAAGGAAALASRADAVQRANDSLLTIVAERRDVDSVLVATARPFARESEGFGPTLKQLASATERPWPPTRDIRCEEAGERLRSRARITVVIFISQCDGPLRKTTKVVAYYRRVDWPQWRLVDDSVRADIISDAKSIEGALVGHR